MRRKHRRYLQRSRCLGMNKLQDNGSRCEPKEPLAKREGKIRSQSSLQDSVEAPQTPEEAAKRGESAGPSRRLVLRAYGAQLRTSFAPGALFFYPASPPSGGRILPTRLRVASSGSLREPLSCKTCFTCAFSRFQPHESLLSCTSGAVLPYWMAYLGK